MCSKVQVIYIVYRTFNIHTDNVNICIHICNIHICNMYVYIYVTYICVFQSSGDICGVSRIQHNYMQHTCVIYIYTQICNIHVCNIHIWCIVHSIYIYVTYKYVSYIHVTYIYVTYLYGTTAGVLVAWQQGFRTTFQSAGCTYSVWYLKYNYM